jgi:hypothetical protein
MAITKLVGNISAAANTNIDLRSKIPSPIQSLPVNEGGTATYDILAATTKDLLLITYVSKTEYVAP